MFKLLGNSGGEPFKSGAEDYLQNLVIQEACYRSATDQQPVEISLPQNG